MQLYQDNLFSKSGQKALSYLKDRGLNEDMIKQFKIGFAEDSWDQLVKKCKGRGFTRSQIVQSGLFSQSDKGTFDRFRSRITGSRVRYTGSPHLRQSDSVSEACSGQNRQIGSTPLDVHLKGPTL